MRLPRSGARPFLDQDHDLVVIGAGAAGLGAALAARRSNARVALVAGGPIGGARTHTSGVPTKALAAAATQGRSFADALDHARRAMATLSASADATSLRRSGIDVIEGDARFVAPGEIDAGERRLRCGRFVIATGSQPRVGVLSGGIGVDVLTTDSLLGLVTAPTSLAIVGGGATGCEIAQAFARLGVRVTLFEARERLLPDEEPEASEIVAHVLRTDGVDVRVSARVERIEADGTRGAGRVSAMGREPMTAERVLMAVGRDPVTAGLDLSASGVATDGRGFIVVDEHLRTNVPGTYAAGDVTGGPMLAHAAEEMGRLAAGHALTRGERGPFRPGRVPRVTFTAPEVARVGLTEQDAGRLARVAYLPLTGLDRAVVEGSTDGYVKLIAGPRLPTARLGGGRLLGATIVAPRAGEMIAEVALAMRASMFPARLAQASHAYPTWSGALPLAAAQFLYEVDGRRARRPRR